MVRARIIESANNFESVGEALLVCLSENCVSGKSGGGEQQEVNMDAA
ncbi:hypothetical protein OQJ65_06170 [Vibrio sp. Sgm 22]|nr:MULTISPECIES: hypothetical protein [unclassified Vibrio]MCX2757828.1 hypothetical protein [Vibrio sp. 14G-20]MCX2774893.1 hypothetical protein [Vibrio sp. Sgm 22]